MSNEGIINPNFPCVPQILFEKPLPCSRNSCYPLLPTVYSVLSSVNCPLATSLFLGFRLSACGWFATGFCSVFLPALVFCFGGRGEVWFVWVVALPSWAWCGLGRGTFGLILSLCCFYVVLFGLVLIGLLLGRSFWLWGFSCCGCDCVIVCLFFVIGCVWVLSLFVVGLALVWFGACCCVFSLFFVVFGFGRCVVCLFGFVWRVSCVFGFRFEMFIVVYVVFILFPYRCLFVFGFVS